MAPSYLSDHTLFIFLKIIYLFFIFRERGREGKRDGEKHQCVVASCTPSAGDLAYNPGMCPEWDLNQRPFSSRRPALNPLSHTSQGQSYFNCYSLREAFPNHGIRKALCPNPFPCLSFDTELIVSVQNRLYFFGCLTFFPPLPPLQGYTLQESCAVFPWHFADPGK